MPAFKLLTLEAQGLLPFKLLPGHRRLIGAPGLVREWPRHVDQPGRLDQVGFISSLAAT